MDILEIRKRARAREAQAARRGAVAPAPPPASSIDVVTPLAEPPAPPVAGPDLHAPPAAPPSRVATAPRPEPVGARASVRVSGSRPHEPVREPIDESGEDLDSAEAEDARVLSEFFASERDAAINRFADPTLFSGARGFARSSPDSVRYLTCRLGSEEYGIELSRTREILKPLPLTQVPRAPAEVLGVISLRGRVLPVLDLSGRLGAVATTRGARTERYVVLQVQGEALCVRVDSVSGVVGFGPSEIEPPPAKLRGMESDAVAGIGRLEQRMVILLRIDDIVAALLHAYGEGR